MDILTILLQYNGVDWMVNSAAICSLILLGNKNSVGFLAGMTAASFGVIFSIQILSIPNGITSVIVFLLHMRGYFRWHPNNWSNLLHHTPLSGASME